MSQAAECGSKWVGARKTQGEQKQEIERPRQAKSETEADKIFYNTTHVVGGEGEFTRLKVHVRDVEVSRK